MSLLSPENKRKRELEGLHPFCQEKQVVSYTRSRKKFSYLSLVRTITDHLSTAHIKEGGKAKGTWGDTCGLAKAAVTATPNLGTLHVHPESL